MDKKKIVLIGLAVLVVFGLGGLSIFTWSRYAQLQLALLDAKQQLRERSAAVTMPTWPAPESDFLDCSISRIEKMSPGVYWLLLGSRSSTVDTNRGKSYILRDYSCGRMSVGYSTSVRNGIFIVDWAGYGPGTVTDYYVASSGEPIVSLSGYNTSLNLKRGDKELEIVLDASACNSHDPSLDLDMNISNVVLTKSLSVNDRKIIFAEPHQVRCELNGESGGFEISENFQGSIIDLGRNELRVSLPWGDEVSVDLDHFDPAHVRMISR